eukprot:3261238-Rhodomonas_salina.1
MPVTLESTQLAKLGDRLLNPAVVGAGHVFGRTLVHGDQHLRQGRGRQFARLLAWLALYLFGTEVKDAKLQVETVAPSALQLMAQQHLPRLHVACLASTQSTAAKISCSTRLRNARNFTSHRGTSAIDTFQPAPWLLLLTEMRLAPLFFSGYMHNP